MIIHHILVLLSLIINITKHIAGQKQQQAVMVEYAMVMPYLKQQAGIVTMLSMLLRPTLGSVAVATVALARMQECSASSTWTAMLTVLLLAAFRSVLFSSLRALDLLL